MKKTILFFLLLFFVGVSFAQKKASDELHEHIIHPVFSKIQFISYTVPIALKTTTDMFGKINGENMQINAEELQKLENERLTENERLKFVKTIFEKVRSGEVTAYDGNPINGLFNSDPGMSNFNAMALERKEDGSFYEPHLQYASSEDKLDEYGEPELDENGNPITIDIYMDYKPEDVTSITFYENWSYDLNHETGVFTMIQKQVVGYTLNVPFKDPFSGEIEGTKSLIYIPCTKEAHQDKMISLKKNICTSTKINTPWRFEREWTYESIEGNWYSNNLSSDFRFHFCQFLINLANYSKTLLPNWKVKGIYDTDKGYAVDKDGFPFSEKLPNDSIKSKSGINAIVNVFDDYGEYLLDNNGEYVYEKVFESYEASDIVNLDFIEDWLFDEKTLSIQKKVKGLMPMVHLHNEYTGEINGIKSMYCIKY